MKVSNIKRAKAKIIAFFDGLLPKKVYRHSDLLSILQQQRDVWVIPQHLNTHEFIKFLIKETQMSRVEFDFPYRKEVMYLWGKVPVYEVLMSIKPAGYFSHFTAMYLNDLTDQVPRTIYLNAEQAPAKIRNMELDQQAIKNAFSRPQRTSMNIARYLDYEVRMISSMGIGGIGVKELEGPEGERIRVTDLERTLIDLSVRPDYSGGVFEVLGAYRRSAGKVSSNRLSAFLGQMNYVYPYRQAIGFYLERSGVFSDSAIALFRKTEMKNDFYLAHGMKETEYSERWRLFFPKGF